MDATTEILKKEDIEESFDIMQPVPSGIWLEVEVPHKIQTS